MNDQRIEVILGSEIHQDPNVIIGYPCARVIDDLRLFIGDNSFLRSGTVIYRGK